MFYQQIWTNTLARSCRRMEFGIPLMSCSFSLLSKVRKYAASRVILNVSARVAVERKDDSKSLVVDAGAHVGFFSLLSASFGYQVLAVEAAPFLFSVLESNVKALKAAAPPGTLVPGLVYPRRFALDSQSSMTVDIALDEPKNSGATHVTTGGDSRTTRGESIQFSGFYFPLRILI